MRLLRASAIAPVIAALVVGVPAAAALMPVRTEAVATRQAVSDGAFLYGRDCGWCHGPAGEGSPRGPRLESVGAASVDFMLRTGRMPLSNPEDRMQRRDPAYTRGEIDAIVEFVGTFGDGPPIPDVDLTGDLRLGGRVYRLECAACHGASGGGGALTNAVVPSVLDAEPVEVAEAMIIGPGAMPVFGFSLTEQERHAVVSYVEYLRDPQPRGGFALKGADRVGEGLIAWIALLGVIVPTAIWLGRRR